MKKSQNLRQLKYIIQLELYAFSIAPNIVSNYSVNMFFNILGYSKLFINCLNDFHSKNGLFLYVADFKQ